MKNQFTGIYRGKVVNNGSFKDNRAGAGRVQVWVPGIHPSELLEETKLPSLPWAEPAMPLELGSGPNSGTYTVPEVNTIVWVFFEGGDHLKPVYFAVTPNARAWAANTTNQHVKVIGNSTFSLTVDENYLIEQKKALDLKFSDVKPSTVSNSSNSTAPGTPADTPIASGNGIVLPGVVVNITRAEGGMANVTVFINGMLNIVATGGGTFNALPII